MGSEESMGSCAPASEPAVGVFREEPKNPQRTPDRASYQKNVCFGCNKEGHWLRDCPLRAKLSPGSPDPGAGAGVAGGRRYPETQCPCGRGPCIVLTSRTDRNPNRDFYRCPGKSVTERCKFFLWCDLASPKPQHGYGSPTKPYQQHGANSPAKPDVQHVAGESSYPICSCGAGRCRVLTMTDGENAGRRYFACRIKKGQGACNHFQWVDSPAKLSEKMDNHSDEESVPNFCLVPEEPKKPEMDDDTKNGGLGGNGHRTFILVPETKEARMDDGGAGEAMNEDKPEEMLEMLPQTSVVPESPPLSPKRQNQPNIMLELSGIERVSLHGDSPGASRLGKCYRCGKEGHWMSECVEFPSSPCFKCGRFGHWKKDCTG
ncbi:uncharacterized protein [Elaeis guineensis]|uniref:Uncharacterized protein LOC105060361 n=1 Tax=Elaeis guineensis var. tenera TaxID=51953 RepID=A0A6I9SF50_ELAGV|nr:uncharacterized protein LOC105060361 [Elaeis guineensis]